MSEIDLKKYIRDIPNYPKPGIIFRDITPLLKDSRALSSAIDEITDLFKDKKIDCVVAVEARGFIFGAAVADRLGAGFVPIRKKGKLPWKTTNVEYQLEYGTDIVEIHSDAVEKGTRVLMLDDLLATGGTMAAACDLIENLGGKVAGVAFLIELTQLNGREKLKGRDVRTVIKF